MKTSKCEHQIVDQFLNLIDSPTVDDSTLQTHLENCEECQSYYESRIASEDFWEEASQLLRPTEFDAAGSPECSAGSLGSIPVTSLQVNDLLARLAPTDDPHSLGRIDGYEVRGVVGTGSMGVVLKAHDPSLDRIVAIKVLSPHLASSGTARRRFEREARAVAAILHPNVIPIHSVSGEAELPYFVMSYIRGESLQNRLNRDGPLQVEAILRIGHQVAAGLSAAHEKGLVHRDIKPANILLEGTTERVTITDFGLARAVDDVSLTRAGVIAGTPQYMSPEQSNAENVDQRSDLFSLGSLLYALCTGRPPFRSESSYGLIREINETSPKAIQDLNPGIPIWLCTLITKLMSKDKSKRLGSADEVRSLLESCLKHVEQPALVPVPDELSVPTTNTVSHNAFRSKTTMGVILMATFFFAAILFTQLPTTDNAQDTGKTSRKQQNGTAVTEQQPNQNLNVSNLSLAEVKRRLPTIRDADHPRIVKSPEHKLLLQRLGALQGEQGVDFLIARYGKEPDAQYYIVDAMQYVFTGWMSADSKAASNALLKVAGSSRNLIQEQSRSTVEWKSVTLVLKGDFSFFPIWNLTTTGISAATKADPELGFTLLKRREMRVKGQKFDSLVKAYTQALPPDTDREKVKRQLDQLKKEDINDSAARNSDESALAAAIADAASVPTSEFASVLIAPGPATKSMPKTVSESLSILLLKLQFLDKARENPSVLEDFRWISRGIPQPAALMKLVSSEAMASTKPDGRVSMLQPTFIRILNSSAKDDRITGSFAFEAPEMFKGRANFVAQRLETGEVQVLQFELPNYGIVVTPKKRSEGKQLGHAKEVTASTHKAEGQAENPLAPTGLTLIVCDNTDNVLETFVVPDDGKTRNIEFTAPQGHEQLRVFVIGTRVNQENAELFARNYFVGGTGMEADIENGIYCGCSAVSDVRPLVLDDQLRAQVKKNLKAPKKASVIKVNILRNERRDENPDRATVPRDGDGKVVVQAKPVLLWIESVRTSDLAQFRTVWSKQAWKQSGIKRQEAKADDWSWLLEHHAELWVEQFPSSTIADFTFSYKGGQANGKVIVKFKGKQIDPGVVGPLSVLKENGEWKMGAIPHE